MLTKQADALVGSLTGAVRASLLSEDDKKLLRKHYGLGSDSNLAARNAGRGAVGGGLGGVVGTGLGLALQGATKGKFNPKLIRMFPMISGVTGSTLATKKYSRKNADEIRQG